MSLLLHDSFEDSSGISGFGHLRTISRLISDGSVTSVISGSGILRTHSRINASTGTVIHPVSTQVSGYIGYSYKKPLSTKIAVPKKDFNVEFIDGLAKLVAKPKIRSIGAVQTPQIQEHIQKQIDLIIKPTIKSKHFKENELLELVMLLDEF